MRGFCRQILRESPVDRQDIKRLGGVLEKAAARKSSSATVEMRKLRDFGHAMLFAEFILICCVRGVRLPYTMVK